jgi:hypothetical protein
LDFAGIERRGRMVPLFLRPRHVVEHYIATPPLHGNLDNAITAFIFGALKAAFAHSRVTLEATPRDFGVSGFDVIGTMQALQA